MINQLVGRGRVRVLQGERNANTGRDLHGVVAKIERFGQPLPNFFCDDFDLPRILQVLQDNDKFIAT